jgi:phosphatidylinositol-3-phosphatase
VGIVVVAAACGSPVRHAAVRPGAPLPRSTSTSTIATPPAGVAHVMVVVLENRERGAVLSDPQAPYLDGLARRFGTADNAVATTHPSLPNYLELLAGTTFGIDSDCGDCRVDGSTLVDQLDTKGIGWKAYMEAMPAPCYRGVSDGTYAKKHDPFMYVSHLADDPALCQRVVPYSQLSPDLTSGRAPPFLWVTPDLCDDGHDCATATMDTWMAKNLEPVLASSWFKDHGVVIVTFDEGTSGASCCDGAHGGRIATIVAAQGAPGGLRSTQPVDHAGTLATIEDLYGVANLGDAACPCAGSLTPLL